MSNQEIIVNEFEDQPDDRIPSDIEAFMSEHGIGDRYQCLLKMWVNQEATVQNQYNNAYPSIMDVGKQFGPGKFSWCFSWYSENPDGGKKKKRMLEYTHVLGEAFREVHEDWLFDQAEIRDRKRMEKLKRRKEEVELRQVENGGRNVPVDAGGTARDMLEQSLSYTERLMTIAKGPTVPVNNDNPMMAVMLKSMELTMGMMMAQQKSTTELMIALLTQKAPQGGGDDMFEKLFNLADRMTTVKREQEPEEKETLAEKVFGFLMQMGPAVLELLAKSAEERARNPIYNMAMKTKEMEALKSDPEALAHLVNKLDPVWGPAKVDELLQGAGLARPSATRGNYQKYAGWPRKAGQTPTNGHIRPQGAPRPAPAGVRPAGAGQAPQAPQGGPTASANPFSGPDDDDEDED